LQQSVAEPTVERGSVGAAARGLHSYLVRAHWTGDALEGPDVGIRFNSRFGRFIKSYLPFLSWADRLRYNQTQGYWIAANWLVHDLFDEQEAATLALATADDLLARQKEGGYWEYPNPEWRGRIATVEGNFATLGLLQAFERTQGERYLEGVRRWHRYLVTEMGFQEFNGGLAVNYFANRPSGMVPNNSTLTARTLARVAQVTGDDSYLEQCPALIRFVRDAQKDTGELPYIVGRKAGEGRPHFLCFQYNAFEALDLIEYHRVSGDGDVLPIVAGVGRFLTGALAPSGGARYDCSDDRPEILYYTAAVAAALSQIAELGLGDYRNLADTAYARVLAAQRDDGGMSYFSIGDYGFLSDRRSYPRNLAMILYHLMLEHSRVEGRR
jgi:uncharacterized protein YyaL (SSP411 family)